MILFVIENLIIYATIRIRNNTLMNCHLRNVVTEISVMSLHNIIIHSLLTGIAAFNVYGFSYY